MSSVFQVVHRLVAYFGVICHVRVNTSVVPIQVEVRIRMSINDFHNVIY